MDNLEVQARLLRVRYGAIGLLLGAALFALEAVLHGSIRWAGPGMMAATSVIYVVAALRQTIPLLRSRLLLSAATFLLMAVFFAVFVR